MQVARSNSSHLHRFIGSGTKLGPVEDNHPADNDYLSRFLPGAELKTQYYGSPRHLLPLLVKKQQQRRGKWILSDSQTLQLVFV